VFELEKCDSQLILLTSLTHTPPNSIKYQVAESCEIKWTKKLKSIEAMRH